MKTFLRGFGAVVLAFIIISGVIFSAAVFKEHRAGVPLAQSLASSAPHDLLAEINAIFKMPGFKSPSAAVATAPVELYKPVADYESAVVASVKRVSPAVVSITISKNVPTLENCRRQADPGVPSDLRQFFGGFPGFITCDNGSELQEIGGGSGFIISADGLIVTNKHVVADTGAAYTVFTNDGKKYTARVLGRDPAQDLAILKIDGTNLPTVALGDSDALELGESAIVIGNALGEFRNTVSVGVISGLGRSITAVGNNTSETIQGVIQTDAAINPGNSGGPLVNLKGEVIGVSVATAQGAQNIGFALPINWAKHDIQTVLAGGEIKAPYLGVRYATLNAELANQKNLDVNYGALLAADGSGPAVVKDSPADKAGLREGDIVLAVNGQSMEGKDLGQVIQSHNIGDVLRFDIFRDKRTISKAVTLGERGQ